MTAIVTPTGQPERKTTQMKNIKTWVPVLAMACTIILAACSSPGPAAKTDPPGLLYVCSCGADCKCTAASTQPGKCGCGHDLVAGHVKKVAAGVALLCQCPADCKCGVDAKDPAKCGCGKPLRKVSLKGTGLYCCNCGGACCAIVSDKPGQCKCGKALQKAD